MDPALRAVLAYRQEPPLRDRMVKALDERDLAGAIREYRTYRADPRHAYLDTENELNQIGYRELKENRIDQAIALFRLNVAEHPSSGNVYDSLGEALLLAGQRDAAIRQYRKSLQLDPRNENARSVLEQLQR